MPDIFTYIDYCRFLSDYYNERKTDNPSFSYKLFSEKAGFSSKGFLHNVISGNKKLARSSMVKLSQAMKLSPREADYFENLVSFNQSKNLRESNYFFEKLNSIKSNVTGAAKIRKTRNDQYEFYSKWYISVIRSLIDMYDFRDDYKWLAQKVFPRIKPVEAKKAVSILEDLGMIKKAANGRYFLSDKTITAGDEIVKLGLLNFHLQTISLASKALEELPREKRNISGLTLGISKKSYEKMCEEIQAFQERILSIAENDNEADNVYQMNFQFFPVSDENKKDKQKRKRS